MSWSNRDQLEDAGQSADVDEETELKGKKKKKKKHREDMISIIIIDRYSICMLCYDCYLLKLLYVFSWKGNEQ